MKKYIKTLIKILYYGGTLYDRKPLYKRQRE